MTNHYARKVQDDRRAMLNRGMIVGQQWAIDLMCISLHRLGWGYDRVKRLLDRMEQADNEFLPALKLCMEQDVMQERMDRELRDLIKDKQDLIPFEKRYPDVKTLGYDKLPRR